MVSTIKDVARVSGVSIATVSRVLNNIGGYSKEVEEKVLFVAKELGYRKNEAAISLVKRTTKTVGILMPNMDTSFYVKIVDGIEEEAHLRGYSVILTHAGVAGVRFQESLNLLAERRVDGIIVFSINLSSEDVTFIEALEIPVILVSAEAPSTNIPHLKVNDYQAAFSATEFLINCGHRNIGLVGLNPEDAIAGIPREKGYKDALEKHDIRYNQNFVKHGFFSFESGLFGMEEFLSKQEPITAVFCASDETALGVISACFRNGIQVPEEISVVGYDNSNISFMSTPPLTTISQPFHEMGKQSCKKLIDSILDGTPMVSEIVPFELIERLSVKKSTSFVNDKK